jgi:hypothetical protein
MAEYGGLILTATWGRLGLEKMGQTGSVKTQANRYGLRSKNGLQRRAQNE